MPQLPDRDWRLKYTPDDGDFVKTFYVPALECALHYDRTTGYFTASALALAMRGVEGLVRNSGRMRLVVGCTLDEKEIAAIEKGESLRDAVDRHLVSRPLEPPDDAARDALELLVWMIGNGFLDVKVAVPCDNQRRPMASDGIFHEKAGVIGDHAGHRLAFNGSNNETASGWSKNWEAFTVFTSWSGTAAYVEEEAKTFATLWANQAKRALVLDVPSAVRADLMRFMPTNDLPARLRAKDGTRAPYQTPTKPAPTVVDPEPEVDERRLTWEHIATAATLPNGGERVGEATCAVEPWPHQIRAFQRLYGAESPRLLIADEVGLGKTIQAGMLLRQAWLSGRAKRILILTPAAVMQQWQLELREKFNLNWPIYDDGLLTWYPSPGMRGRSQRPVGRTDWHKEPVVIASSHLMRRRERENELCVDATPWDLIVLDEAHHARRKGAGSDKQEGPNTLLRLMRNLRARTKGLVLMTATPMQVHPIEVWDLLDLLGLPDAWNETAFLRYFALLGKPSPSHEELDELASMFRDAEAEWGPVGAETMERLGVTSKLKSKKILGALRDPSNIPRRSLETSDRQAALRVLRSTTPVSKLMSRHTRDLLRRYHKAGKLATPIATRKVDDTFIELTQAEREVYERVEDYIATTYNQAALAGGAAKNAVGFVMTVYRRRLASSFRALGKTLEGRLEPLATKSISTHLNLAAAENASDDESRDEVMDADEATQLEQVALKLEESDDIQNLLKQVRILAPDTKARVLRDTLRQLRTDGYGQAMVFTQFTDTMDFLRSYLVSEDAKERSTEGAAAALPRILCFSGRGGETPVPGGTWQSISRDEVKRRFRAGEADVLLCTDAAAEGLNFQFCGALVNYDMPWNPMRVEQRIGRIDRLGQRHEVVRIVNLHYKNTVEADVYLALRKRIGLFESVVGRLQPILAELPRRISATVLQGGRATDATRAQLASDVVSRVDALANDTTGLDLDLLGDDVLDVPLRNAPALDLEYLDGVIVRESVMPPGIAVRSLGVREYGYLSPGMTGELRVTTDAAYYETHADSVELWSPGSPLFPDPARVLRGM